MTSELNTVEALQTENSVLRQDIVKLKQQLDDAEQHAVALVQAQQHLQAIIDAVPYAVYWKDISLVYEGCNRRFTTDLNMPAQEIVGKTDADLPWNPEEVEYFQSVDRRVIATGTTDYNTDETVIHADGTQEWFETYKVPISGAGGATVGVLGSYTNITERKQAAEALRQASLQQDIITAQQAALRELSTPLIPIMEGVVAMPLIGTIDNVRAQQIMETLLEGISELQADIAILDITGVEIVDTQVANALIRTAQAVQLLGAQVILTGLRTQVAQALVHLGVDLSGITTRANLQSGIAYALERR